MTALVLAVLLLGILVYRHKTWKALTWPQAALRPPPLQAHRGYWQGGAQENTLMAFQAARDRGFEMFELDVRLSADGIPVVFHDADLLRLGGKRKDLVAATTAENLKQWAQVSLLEEVLTSADVPRFINIELKSNHILDGALEQAVAALIRKHACESRVLFSSFNPLALWRIKKLLPEVPRALLATQEDDAENKIYLRQMWLAPYIGVHALHLDQNYVQPEDIAYWKKRQIPVGLWTVNDPEKARQFLRAGALSVISDSVVKADSSP
ncbi:glycerophosphodiester phosphodiesterase [Bdellovibrio bacteriovorus]|uniref:glycerophosphodiester phosphodiesterase n=1 Tax=Bdellovibrio bacteriovorus TaxID=959 RepID=UPI0021CFC41E|nr:glycerophosphodiester phosphodiesterase [Bdellovibrio bacteriovorus]UXR63369.1 glycerophosphodiester phosphodiesterase [Bdellovibrio bacteriovorus]